MMMAVYCAQGVWGAGFAPGACQLGVSLSLAFGNAVQTGLLMFCRSSRKWHYHQLPGHWPAVAPFLAEGTLLWGA